jgi:hypothetical protein
LQIKAAFPVKSVKERQSFDVMEFAAGGKCIALPGKDPYKIRLMHPARLILDEALLHRGEAYDVAISSKVPQIKVIRSAAPSWFRRFTKGAVPEALGKT